MWKRVSVIGAIVLALLVAAISGYYQIKERSLSEATDLYAVVPSQTVLVIETRNMMSLSKALLHENDFCELMDESELLSGLKTILEQTRQLYTRDGGLQSEAGRQALIAYSLDDKQIWKDLLLIRTTAKEADRNRELIRSQLCPDKKTEKTKYEGINIYTFPDSTGGQYLYACSYVDGVFAGSRHLSEVQKVIDVAREKSTGLAKDTVFAELKMTAGKNVLANVFVDTKVLFPLFSAELNNNYTLLKKKIDSFAGWVGLDLSISDGQMLVNGYSTRNPAYFSEIFDGQEPVLGGFYEKLPLNTCFFTYYGISDYQLFRQKINKAVSSNSKGEAFVKEHFAGEVVNGYVNLHPGIKQGNYVMLSVKDSTLVTEQLDVIASKTVRSSVYSYRGITVYELPQQYQLTAAFGDFMALKGKEYVFVYGDGMLITTSADLLTELGGLLLSGYTLSKDLVFRSAEESYDDRSTVLSYVHFPSLLNYAGEIFTPSFAKKIKQQKDKLSNIQSLGWQMGNERNLVYHNAFVKCTTASAQEGSEETDSVVTPVVLPQKKTSRVVWSTPFSKKLVYGPVIVRNNITGADEILIQDEDNKLNFYTHDGKWLWAYQVDAPIMPGDIYQVDFYKNNKYQFMFNTAGKMYMVDRKGRTVENYPIALPFKASAGLSVFDYENTKDYRIFIPGTDKKIYLYKKDGSTPPDWAFGTAKDVISSPIQYIDMDGKDYLAANDGNNVYLLNRKGKERVSIKSAVDISNNKIYLQPKTKDMQAAFVVTDKQAYLKRIGADGVVKSVKIADDLSKDHSFIQTQVGKAIVYIFTDNNTISVYDQGMKRIFVKQLEESGLQPFLYNDMLGVYSSSSDNVRIFDLNRLDDDEQVFETKIKPALGQLKPMPNTYLITVNDGKLICYELN